MRKIKLYCILVLVLAFCTCKKFEYNVYETNGPETTPGKKDVEVTTQYNIERLLKRPHKDTLHLVFAGDIHRFYDDTEDMVEAINELTEIDAVVITGDLVDFGTARNFAFINRQLKLLKVPFITVIGNHDCLANGAEVYEDIYGALDYSFTWNDIRFVAHNTNSREFDFSGNVPDLNWMKQQVADTSAYRGCIFISHVPPYSDDFDHSLEAGYTKLIHEAKNTIFSSNGHRHDNGLDKPYNDGTWYLNTSSPSKRIYCYVTIYPYAPSSKKFDCVPVSF